MLESGAMPTALTLQALYKPIEHGLADVRLAIRQHWADVLSLVQGRAIQPPRNSGKLLRPALCLLAARAAGAHSTAAFVPMATAVELFHLAALAHDDVIDGATVRRGTTSLNALRDNHAAVLGGDYLVAKGIALLTRCGSCEVVADAADCIREMAEGELAAGSDGTAEESCLALARAKTAVLFATSCALPARLVDPACRSALHRFGMQLGTAFQLVDDLLDLSTDEQTLGKPTCQDIEEGKTTLPILYMRQAMNRKDLERLDSFQTSPPTAQDRRWVATSLELTGARQRTESVARACIDDAREALSGLAASEFRDSMLGLAEFVLIRAT